MTIWNKIDGWTYECFERDVAPETLPGFEDMIRLWRGKRGGRPVPARSDFDFADFAALKQPARLNGLAEAIEIHVKQFPFFALGVSEDGAKAVFAPVNRFPFLRAKINR